MAGHAAIADALEGLVTVLRKHITDTLFADLSGIPVALAHPDETDGEDAVLVVLQGFEQDESGVRTLPGPAQRALRLELIIALIPRLDDPAAAHTVLGRVLQVLFENPVLPGGLTLYWEGAVNLGERIGALVRLKGVALT